MITEAYRIDGMSCAACSSAVERVTNKIDGVEHSEVNLTTGKMTITYDESKVTRELIESKVERAGFQASLIEAKKEQESDREMFEQQEENLSRHPHPGDCQHPFCPASFISVHGTYAALYPAPPKVSRNGFPPACICAGAADFHVTGSDLRQPFLYSRFQDVIERPSQYGFPGGYRYRQRIFLQPLYDG